MASNNHNPTDYHSFLASKVRRAEMAGFTPPPSSLNSRLFNWQADLVTWFCRLGRGACFADTGLGKTAMQLAWAEQVVRHTNGRVLILAPLAVASQTKREAEKFAIGVEVKVCRERSDLTTAAGINITNYDRLHKFDPADFAAVVPDESSILKHIDSKTREQITTAFDRTRYKLPCTATPAPNDQMELGNHSQFCGWMSRAEMLATYFVHDGGETQKWRLRGHASEAFYAWLASWAAMVRKPSDLGYGDDGFILPPLNFIEHTVETGQMPGWLFPVEAKTLSDQREVRRNTIEDRVALLAKLANEGPAASETWVVWCNLNDESTAAAKAIKGAVEVCGSQETEEKEEKLVSFATPGSGVRVMVSKPSIAGFGLNWQHCHNVAFLGISHSYEQFYQAIRRCWRFGQKHPVNVHIIVTDRDAAVLDNIHRKEREHEKMLTGMVAAVADSLRENIRTGAADHTEYRPRQRMRLPLWIGGGAGLGTELKATATAITEA